MTIFKLPDLGEGLPDAEVREWLVKAGDEVTIDQPLVAMETAKAVVEVPSPQSGKIKKCYGEPGDIIDVDTPLVEFESDEKAEPKADTGTVVGKIETSDVILQESATGVTTAKTQTKISATPAVRALAKKLNIDLTQLSGTGPNGHITIDDVTNAQSTTTSASNMQTLHSTRRAMSVAMSKAHKEVALVTLFDEADIGHWKDDEDISVRLLQAFIPACQQEPNLNAYFDGDNIAAETFDTINLGVAVDTKKGLFVPVIKDISNKTAEQLRAELNQFKQKAKDNAFTPDDLHNPTITLSNFGSLAGRFATPMVVPPQVAIAGVGKIYDAIVAHQGQPAVHKVIPISLSFDHRAVTGGEASRFLHAFIENLSC